MAKRAKSGLKRKRQAVKRTARNQAVQSRVKTLVKKAREAGVSSSPAGGAPASAGTGRPSPEDLLAAIRALDAAAGKGIVHPNTAARKKSRLIRHAVRARAAASA